MSTRLPILTQPIFGGMKYSSLIGSLNPTAYWMLNDASGRIANESRGYAATVDLMHNGDFETAGAGGADIWSSWTETAGDGAIADEGVIVHGGAHACKLTSGAGANTYIRLGVASNLIGAFLIGLRPGMACTLAFWTRGDGVNAGRYSVYDNTNGAWIRTTVPTGVTGTDYAQVTYTFTVPANCYNLYFTLLGPSANGGVCYFDDVTFTVANMPLDGIYAATGVTCGATGMGDGKTAVAVTGVDTYVEIGNRVFNSVWNGNRGSAIAWGKVDAAERWTDASTFRYLFHIKTRVSNFTYLVFGKHTDSHTIFWRRRIENAIFEKTHVFNPAGTTDWFCMGMIWDVVSSPKRIAGFLYADGAWSKVFDEEPTVGNEVWVNATHPVDDGNAVLLAGSTTAQEWIGSGAHMAYWPDRVLTDSQMKKVMKVNL
jgi:hypothetical protein